MKKLFNIFAIALASVLMFSCQEDADIDNFGHGGTVNGKFSLVVPSNEMVEITRASEEAESEVTNVYLFYFDEFDQAMNVVDGKNYEEIVLGTATQSGNYTRTYNVGTKAKFNDGDVVNIYAIANTSSSLGTIADFIAVANNFAQFEQLMMTLNTLNTPFSSMVMSGKLNVVASAQYGATGTIEVKRPYAKVNFTIKNGNSNFTFTPTQYNVKNVPTNGALFEGAKVSDLKVVNHDDMTDFVENQGAQVIEFFMLENLAGNAEGVASYNDREKRKDINGGSHSEFAHGLTTATYVEIKGEGKGTNAAGEPISATVTYTIHLGDFANDATDFNVKRNHWYNYTVTVSGVNKIVVEAESEEMDDNGFQHGAEGTVINLEGSSMVYTLDAHYEQVLLNINPKSILVNGEIDTKTPVLFVSTPFMKETAMITWDDLTDLQFDSKYDTKWVEFYRADALCEYPGADKTMSAVEFLNFIMGEALNGTESIMVVAYINEYFYDNNPLTGEENIHWSEFVNKEDRVMRILQAPQISADGYSISTKALCAFTQRSIRTFFNENTVGAYGMEWYDETGIKSEFSYSGSSSDNGLVNFTDQSLTDKINYNNVGYGIDGQPNGNVYSSLSMSDAGYVCLARNRSASDPKWYPAAPNQLVSYWFGEASVPNDAKLYKGNPAENITSAEGWSDGGHGYLAFHFTSGPSNKRIFWTIEGAAFSSNSTWYGVRGKGHHIRCMRNFDTDVAKPAEKSSITTPEGNTATAIIIKNFNESAYRGIATQRLPIHHEREAANKLPKAFIVARNTLNATWTAESDAPTTPQIVSVETTNNGIIVKFLNKDTYAYATSSTGSKTAFNLGAENSFVINNPSGTYYFFAKRAYNSYSQYVTVSQTNGVWTANNTPAGTASGTSPNIQAGSSSTDIPMMAAIYQDLCSQYTSESANGTAWRVPNQKELLAMNTLNVGEVDDLSSTLFSARNYSSVNGTVRYGYMWYSSSSFGLYSYNDTGKVRCVRDASEAELEALGASNSGDMNEDDF